MDVVSVPASVRLHQRQHAARLRYRRQVLLFHLFRPYLTTGSMPNMECRVGHSSRHLKCDLQHDTGFGYASAATTVGFWCGNTNPAGFRHGGVKIPGEFVIDVFEPILIRISLA